MGIFLNQLIRFYYRLEEAYIVLGIAEGFFSVITPQNLNGYGRNLEYKCRTTVRTRTKKSVFFCYQLNAAFRTFILHRFRNNGHEPVYRSVHP